MSAAASQRLVQADAVEAVMPQAAAFDNRLQMASSPRRSVYQDWSPRSRTRAYQGFAGSTSCLAASASKQLMGRGDETGSKADDQGPWVRGVVELEISAAVTSSQGTKNR
jgi:hypothetical protein